jgi:hypothetical protein
MTGQHAVPGCSQGAEGLRQQLALSDVLQFLLTSRQSTPGAATARAYQGHGLSQDVVVMYAGQAAELTNHIWSLREVLLYWVPP